jgi:hypothetical protein
MDQPEPEFLFMDGFQFFGKIINKTRGVNESKKNIKPYHS